MILGHKTQIEILEKILNQEKNNFAFLFVGPEGIGKKTVALHFFEKILGKNPLFHPDFFFLKSEDGKKIFIEKIRKELIPFLSLKPFNAPLKCVLIDDVHLMTLEGQQALLKTLEEPKGKTLIIVVTHLPDLLLPTFRSRLQKIVFFQPTKKEIEAYLNKMKIEKTLLNEILEFSFLKPSFIFRFLENKEKLKEKKEEIFRLVKILKMPLFEKFVWAKELSKKENLKEILGLWVFYFRKLALNEIEKKSISERLLKINEVLSQLDDLTFLISFDKINKQLALETFFLKV